MKKLLFLTAIYFASITATLAQDGERLFKKFKGDVSMGYATFPGNSDIKSGLIIALEPKLAVIDRLALGGRFELNMLGKEIKSSNPYSENEIKVKVYESFNLTADFYLTNNYNARPFIGAGCGIFTVAEATDQYSYNTQSGTKTITKFGGMFRAGVEIKHFRIGIEYNLVPQSSASFDHYDSDGNYVTTEEVSKNSYIGIKAGFCFGGGPRNKD